MSVWTRHVLSLPQRMNAHMCDHLKYIRYIQGGMYDSVLSCMTVWPYRMKYACSCKACWECFCYISLACMGGAYVVCLLGYVLTCCLLHIHAARIAYIHHCTLSACNQASSSHLALTITMSQATHFNEMHAPVSPSPPARQCMAPPAACRLAPCIRSKAE